MARKNLSDLDRLIQAVPSLTGARVFNCGTANITYGAGATRYSSVVSVTHGLGAVPIFITAQTKTFAFAEGGPDDIGFTGASATSFDMWGKRIVAAGEAIPAGGLVVPVYWLAIA